MGFMVIKDLKSGEKIDDKFVIRKKELRSRKDSKVKFLSIEFGDSSGRLFGTLWDKVERTNSKINVGDIVTVKGSVIDWKGRKHISIDSIEPDKAGEEEDKEGFVPQSDQDVTEMSAHFLAMIDLVKNAYLYQLLKMIFESESILECFQKAAAGKLWHHNYAGGLVEHSFNVSQICLKLSEFYTDLDRDLILTGAMLHDIGKIKEYNCKGFIDYSDDGRLIGHVTLGYGFVKSFIDRMDEFPESLKLKLMHLLVSHQGKREKGSPVEPMTREAFVLYYADEIDSKLGAFERIYKRENEKGKSWSSYVKLLNRFLYFGEDEEESAAE